MATWLQEWEGEEVKVVEDKPLLSPLLVDREQVEAANSSKTAEQRQITEGTCKLISHLATLAMCLSRLPLWEQKARRNTWQL